MAPNTLALVKAPASAAVVGTDRLLFSTDFPFQYRPGRDARRFLENCGLHEAAKAGFAHGNRQRLTAEHDV